MAQVVIADAGPLIALAKIDLLAILQQMFGNVVIPKAVQQECLIKFSQDSHRIEQAIKTGILQIKTPEYETPMPTLSRSLGDGEKEAIYLAIQSKNALIIVDDRLARKQAIKLELAFIGTVRLLDMAEKQGIITDAAHTIEAISKTGYRISKDILKQIRGNQCP